MSPQAKKLSVQFALLEGFYWSSNCMLYAFMVNILLSYGMSTFVSGLTLTLLALISLFAQPLSGYISDTFITAKKLVLICFSIAAVITVFIPSLFKLSPWIAIGAILILSVFDYSIYTVIDVWAVRAIEDNPGMDFAVVRSGGSVFFAVTAFFMGNLLSTAGTNILFTGHLLTLVAGTVTAMFIVEYPCPNSKKYPGSRLVNAPKGDTLLSAFKQLLTNRKYVVAIISLSIYQMANRVTQSYLAVVIEHFGGDSGHMGIAMFLGSGSEVFVMLLAGFILNRGFSLTYAFAGFLCVMTVRITLLIIPGGVMVPVVSQLIQSIAVGIYLRTLPNYIGSITPRNLTATACTLAIALSMGLGAVPGNLLGGMIIDNFGMDFYIRISIVLAVISIVAFLPNLLDEYKHKEKEKEYVS